MGDEDKIRKLSPADFLFGSTLGEGAYARVVHARMKKSTFQDFAIKIMEKDHIKKENKVKYVMMEKNILSKISHPFIIKFYFSFHDVGYLYMCMDLAPGGELLGYISQKRHENEEKGILGQALDLEATRFYTSEIIDALEYLHRNEIIHRDMKPENVLISASGHIKITDFGTALMGCPFHRVQEVAEELVDDEDGDNEEPRTSFVGTAEYVSPEVLHNEKVFRACDLWAVGCIVFQLITGSPPFRAPSEYLTFQTILTHSDGSNPLQYPPEISGDARNLCEHLLKGSASERLGSGNDGTANDYNALKHHPFFGSLDWTSLTSVQPPYVPDASRFINADNLRDGADDDWLLEGEATLIEGNTRSSDEDDLPSGSPMTPSRSGNLFFGSSSSTSSSSNNRNKGDSANTNQVLSVASYLENQEKQVFTGIVLKRKGLFTKKRQLVLTDLPRLLYIDPETAEMKGTIPWTKEHPVACEILSNTSFDVLCTKTGRRYHLTDPEAGSRMWVDLINAMLERQLEGSN